MRLVDCFISGNLTEAKEIIDQKIRDLFEKKLERIKERILHEEKLNLDEVRNIQKMGRIKLVRLRVRGGKVQKRKKLSSAPGYTIRGGRLVRMSPLERRRRKMGARRAKFKIRAKKSQILRKRRISLRRRKAIGLR